MPSFRKAKNQAIYAVQKLIAHGHPRSETRKTGKISSVGTTRVYTQVYTQVAQWFKDTGRKEGLLRELNRSTAQEYLTWRSGTVSQKTLNSDRVALQKLLGEKLERVKSIYDKGRKLAQESRAYTPEQIKAITVNMPERLALATKIATACGLRAHELHTLQKAEERPATSNRPWKDERFTGIEGKCYTVQGKGGLIREVRISSELAQELEARRLETPEKITDRNVHYQKHYDVAGGQAWSQAFSKTSKQTLGWSAGAHGLRHSYAQTRLEALQAQGFNYAEAREIVSQEVGHFRQDITEVYLR